MIKKTKAAKKVLSGPVSVVDVVSVVNVVSVVDVVSVVNVVSELDPGVSDPILSSCS